MSNYALGQSWGRANIQDRLWYAQTENDKTSLKSSENLQPGDKIYVIATKKVYIMGFDNQLYDM